MDEEPELVSKFGVMSIPTVIAFKDGKATNKVMGFRSKEDFKDNIGIQRYFYKFSESV